MWNWRRNLKKKKRIKTFVFVGTDFYLWAAFVFVSLICRQLIYFILQIMMCAGCFFFFLSIKTLVVCLFYSLVVVCWVDCCWFNFEFTYRCKWVHFVWNFLGCFHTEDLWLNVSVLAAARLFIGAHRACDGPRHRDWGEKRANNNYNNDVAMRACSGRWILFNISFVVLSWVIWVWVPRFYHMHTMLAVYVVLLLSFFLFLFVFTFHSPLAALCQRLHVCCWNFFFFLSVSHHRHRHRRRWKATGHSEMQCAHRE